MCVNKPYAPAPCAVLSPVSYSNAKCDCVRVKYPVEYMYIYLLRLIIVVSSRSQRPPLSKMPRALWASPCRLTWTFSAVLIPSRKVRYCVTPRRSQGSNQVSKCVRAKREAQSVVEEVKAYPLQQRRLLRQHVEYTAILLKGFYTLAFVI